MSHTLRLNPPDPSIPEQKTNRVYPKLLHQPLLLNLLDPSAPGLKTGWFIVKVLHQSLWLNLLGPFPCPKPRQRIVKLLHPPLLLRLLLWRLHPDDEKKKDNS